MFRFFMEPGCAAVELARDGIFGIYSMITDDYRNFTGWTYVISNKIQTL